MSSIDDISIVSADFDARPALLAAGSSATDSVIKRARMVRAILMFSRKNSRIKGFRVKLQFREPRRRNLEKSAAYRDPRGYSP